MILKWFRENNGSIGGWLTGRFYAWCFKKDGKSTFFWILTSTLAYATMIMLGCVFLFINYLAFVR
jgi:hypothetical protein